MPVLTCGGMRLQQSWAGACDVPIAESVVSTVQLPRAPLLRPLCLH
jgi:hypothetical protein